MIAARPITLRFATIEPRDFGCAVLFHDGTYVNSVAQTDAHYHVIAHRCGYNDDVLRYCFEHDFAHLFVCERFHFGPSQILWALAHGRELLASEAAFEEIAAQTFQRWMRANEQPIIGGVDWFGLRREALAFLDGDEPSPSSAQIDPLAIRPPVNTSVNPDDARNPQVHKS